MSDRLGLPALIVVTLLGTMIYALHADLDGPFPGGENARTPQQTTANQEHQNGAYNQSRPESGRSGDPENTHDQRSGITGEAKTESQWYASAEWWTAGFTGALFIVTAGLWLFTGLLWWSTRRAVVEGQHAIKAARVNAAAAIRQARISQRALKVSEDSSERQLRAYMTIRITNFGAFTTDKPFPIRYDIINHGQTPATQITIARAMDILPYPLPDGFVLPKPTDVQGEFLSWPNSTQNGATRPNRLFSLAEISEVQNGKGLNRVYFWGQISYNDTFQKNRFTNFCFSLDPDSIHDDGGTWALAPGYNGLS